MVYYNYTCMRTKINSYYYFTDSLRILGDFQWIWAIFYFPQGSMEYGSYFYFLYKHYLNFWIILTIFCTQQYSTQKFL